MRFTNLLFSLFAICLATTGYSNRIYLEYDSECMDAYSYKYTSGRSTLIHKVYHIKLNDNEKVILEVGVENKLNQPKKPANTRNCGDLSINERTVRQINSGALDLYIVRKDGRGYNVTQVGKASYAQITSNATGYSMADARFSYKFSQPANGINIAANGSNAEVFFKGTLSHDCPKKYLFSKTSTSGGRNYTEFTLIPEIGIVEQKSGFNENDAKNKVMKLAKINNKTLDEYLEFYCRKIKDNGAGKFYRLGLLGSLDKPDQKAKPSDAEVEAELFRVLGRKPTKTNNDDNTTNNNNNNGSTGGNSGDDKFTGLTCSIYKDLDKGLYFDWKTGELANGECGGNKYVNGYMIGGGTVVIDDTKVTPPPPPPAPPTVNFSECTNSSRYGVHVVQRGETLYGISRLYGINVNDLSRWNRLSSTNLIKPCMQLLTRPRDADSGSTTAIETDYEAQYHTVRRNETLYGIARKHGYTVDRLRKMNGMTDSDKIYIGQQIKVSDCNCPADSSVAMGGGDIPTEFEAAGERLDTKSTTGKRRFHVVKQNDTIYSIAKKHNISVATLRSINDLEENEIIIPFQRIYLEN